MRLKVRDNSAEVERQLDALTERIRTTAIPRILNGLLNPAQSAGFKQIAQDYQIPARTMQQYASQQLASSADLQATITVKGRGFPLSVMKPQQGPNGVTVTIKGKRVFIPHAFMPRFAPGHVFARGSYGGVDGGVDGGRLTGQTFGRFAYAVGGKGRRKSNDAQTRHGLPLGELWTFGPVEAFDHSPTVQAMQDDTAQRAPALMQRELSAVARGF